MAGGGVVPSLIPRPSRAPARKRVWNLSQDFLALLSQHVRKMGKPIRTQDLKQSCDFNAYWNTARLPSVLESARMPKAHGNHSEIRKIRHPADSAMPRNPAKDSRRDYVIPCYPPPPPPKSPDKTRQYLKDYQKPPSQHFTTFRHLGGRGAFVENNLMTFP